ncbi:MAG: type II secretion system GspH family protein [Fusobacterium sp.]|nr:type II secretion system GspH family protein [Fusobacterium sp.]
MFNKKHLAFSAFTMAEIMIALTIIGIVSAITIPQLLANTGGRSHKIMMQKQYAVLAQTLRVAHAKLDFDTSDVDRIVNYSKSGEPPFNAQLSIENLLTKTMDIKKLDKTSHAFAGKLLSYTSDAMYSASTTAAIERAGSETSTGVAFDTDEDYRGAIFETRDGAYIIFPDKEKLADNGCSKLSPCLAYIDVNGMEPPNALINCQSDTNTGYLKYKWEDGTNKIIGEDYYSGNTLKGACTIDPMKTNDVFPVLIYGSTIKPATNAADAVLADHS